MTLMELLMAAAIFAALIGALYTALFSGMKLRETAWNNFEADVARGQVVRLIEQDFTNLVVPSGILQGALLGQSKSSGDDYLDQLEFYATTGAVTDKEPWGEVQKIEYFLAEPLSDSNSKSSSSAASAAGMSSNRSASLSSSGKAGSLKSGSYDFVRRTTRNLLATVNEAEDEPAAKWRLLSGVKSLKIEYYDGQDWLDTWDSTTVENANPEGILLRMDFAPDENGRTRPPFEIVCQISQQPRTAPAAASGGASASGGGGAMP